MVRVTTLTLTSSTHAQTEENIHGHSLHHTLVIYDRMYNWWAVKKLAEKISVYHVSGPTCKQMSDGLNWAVKTVGIVHLHFDKQQTTADMQILRSREEHANNSYCVLNSACLTMTTQEPIFQRQPPTKLSPHASSVHKSLSPATLATNNDTEQPFCCRFCLCNFVPADHQLLFFFPNSELIKSKLNNGSILNRLPTGRLVHCCTWSEGIQTCVNTGPFLWKIHINYLGQLKISTKQIPFLKKGFELFSSKGPPKIKKSSSFVLLSIMLTYC